VPDSSVVSPAEPSILRRVLRSWKVRGVVLFVAAVCGWFEFNEWRWEKKWERCVAEARARGVKMFIPEFVAKEQVSDDENFAATPIWREIFAGGGSSGTINSKFRVVQMPRSPKASKSLTRPPRTDLAGWRASMLAANKLTEADAELSDGAAVLRGLDFLQPEFDEIRASMKRPKVRFPVKWEDGFAAKLPHYTAFQSLARLFALSATAKLAEGDAAGAFDDWKTGRDLAVKLDGDPSLIGGLVQASITSIALATVREGMEEHRWTDAQLEAIQERVAGVNPIRRGLGSIAGERANFNTSLEPMIGKAAAYQMFVIPVGNMVPNSAGQFIQRLRARTRNWWRQNQIWYNGFMDEELTMIDPDAEVMRPKLRRFDAEALTGFWDQIDLGLALEVVPVFASCEKKILSTHAMVRMAGLACALERFHLVNSRYPERLEELVPRFVGKHPHDPCGGEPFRYRATHEGYLLYSIGTDLKDDGGKVNEIRDLTSGPDWRWWSPER